MEEDGWVKHLRDLFNLDNQTMLHLVGTGNPLRMDDGLGLEIISNLRRLCHASEYFKIHSPSLRAESILSGIDYARDKALIFDAVDFNAIPGSILFSSLHNSKFGFFSTHNIPVRELPNIASHLDKLFLLGIQPTNVEVGEGLSTPVCDSVEKVISVLTEIMIR